MPKGDPQVERDDSRDDALLVSAAQAGDLHAFGVLVDRHLDMVRAFVALKLPVWHLIDELTHETFVVAYRKLGGFEPGSHLRAWLRAIAGNLVRAEVQRYRRESRNRLAYARQRILEASMDGDETGTGDEVAILRECLDELPDHQRHLVELKYRKRRSVAEIAEAIQRTENAIWQALFRVRRQLRDCIERKRVPEV